MTRTGLSKYSDGQVIHSDIAVPQLLYDVQTFLDQLGKALYIVRWNNQFVKIGFRLLPLVIIRDKVLDVSLFIF